MRALQSQYDVTGGVSNIIGKLIEHISPEKEGPEGTELNTLPENTDADATSLLSKSTDKPSLVND